MQKKRLHHLALGAHDVDALGHFYEKTLGLAKLKTHLHQNGSTRSIWLSLGPAMALMIEEVQETRPPVSKRSNGVFLLSIAMSDTERTLLKQDLKHHFQIEVTHESTFTSYFKDPEGNQVAASSYPFSEEGL